MSSSRQRGMSRNQVKKKGKDDDSQQKKEQNISTDFDFMNTAIVGITKNHGFCFEGTVLFTKSTTKFDTIIKVLQARGRGGRHAYNNSRSKLGLVSLSSITLPNKAIGTVEDWITPAHLSIYLENGLINEDQYSKYMGMIGKTDFTEDANSSGGYLFDDGNGGGGGGGSKEEEGTEEVNLDDL
jgi:hypothetical protein